MRVITLKWANDCAECNAPLEVGAQAEYKKTTGIFCIGHFPTDPEKIRAFRQVKADAKAARYEEWAEKRRAKATALHKRNEPYRGDIAFNTQPGHIPERARVIARTEKAFEHSAIAARMEQKAESLRHVRVKGDADRRREAERAAVDTWVKPGMMVKCAHFEPALVLRVNKKTVTIQGRFSKFPYDKTYISPL